MLPYQENSDKEIFQLNCLEAPIVVEKQRIEYEVVLQKQLWNLEHLKQQAIDHRHSNLYFSLQLDLA